MSCTPIICFFALKQSYNKIMATEKHFTTQRITLTALSIIYKDEPINCFKKVWYLNQPYMLKVVMNKN